MTRLMVLGILSVYGPLSGYEIQQMMQLSQTDAWAGVFPASIYHSLKKMEQENLVELGNVEQTGNRFKSIYRITDSGRQEYVKLIQKAFKTSSVCFPTSLYTALTFYEHLPRADILSALEQQETEITKIYQDMQAGQSAKAELMSIPPNVSFIFQNIFAQCELQLEFIKELKQYLRDGDDK